MIDDKAMESILYLSRLEVGEKDKEHFRSQVDDVISYFNILQKIDTSRVDPDLGAAADMEELREDRRQEGIALQQLKGFAVQFSSGYFSVPRILDGD